MSRKTSTYFILSIMAFYAMAPNFSALTINHQRSTINNPANHGFSIKENPFRYSGYYNDFESKLYYLKARYYSPKLARFISRDTYDLSNRYAYCDGNPLSNIDPSGHSSIASDLIVDSVAMVAFAYFFPEKCLETLVGRVVGGGLSSAAMEFAQNGGTEPSAMITAVILGVVFGAGCGGASYALASDCSFDEQVVYEAQRYHWTKWHDDMGKTLKGQEGCILVSPGNSDLCYKRIANGSADKTKLDVEYLNIANEGTGFRAMYYELPKQFEGDIEGPGYFMPICDGSSTTEGISRIHLRLALNKLYLTDGHKTNFMAYNGKTVLIDAGQVVPVPEITEEALGRTEFEKAFRVRMGIDLSKMEAEQVAAYNTDCIRYYTGCRKERAEIRKWLFGSWRPYMKDLFTNN